MDHVTRKPTCANKAITMETSQTGTARCLVGKCVHDGAEGASGAALLGAGGGGGGVTGIGVRWNCKCGRERGDILSELHFSL